MFRVQSAVGVLALSLLLVTGSSCTRRDEGKSGAPTSGTPDGTSINVGYVGSMTGSEATFGISTQQGIHIALGNLNKAGGITSGVLKGRKVNLITVDDAGKANEATMGVTKLFNQNQVKAILGEVASSLSIAMGPMAQQYKIPMITPSSINSRVTQAGNYVFRVCFVDTFQSRVMADFALKNLKARRAAILRDVKSDYSVDSSNIFAERFKAGGGEIVIDQSYTSGDLDFKSQLTAIRAKNPDIIMVPGYYTDIGLIARDKSKLGIKAPMLGGDGWDSPKLKEIGGEALEGSYFVSHFSAQNPSQEVQSFITQFKAANGVAPDGLAALGYDAAQVLFAALARSKSDAPADIRDAIAATRDFQGVTGKITIGPDRNAIKPAVIFKLTSTGDTQPAATMNP